MKIATTNPNRNPDDDTHTSCVCITHNNLERTFFESFETNIVTLFKTVQGLNEQPGEGGEGYTNKYTNYTHTRCEQQLNTRTVLVPFSWRDNVHPINVVKTHFQRQKQTTVSRVF